MQFPKSTHQANVFPVRLLLVHSSIHPSTNTTTSNSSRAAIASSISTTSRKSTWSLPSPLYCSPASLRNNTYALLRFPVAQPGTSSFRHHRRSRRSHSLWREINTKHMNNIKVYDPVLSPPAAGTANLTPTREFSNKNCSDSRTWSAGVHPSRIPRSIMYESVTTTF